MQSTFLKTQYVKGHIVLFCSLVWKFTAFRQLEGVLALYHKWTSTRFFDLSRHMRLFPPFIYFFLSLACYLTWLLFFLRASFSTPSDYNIWKQSLLWQGKMWQTQWGVTSTFVILPLCFLRHPNPNHFKDIWEFQVHFSKAWKYCWAGSLKSNIGISPFNKHNSCVYCTVQ